MIVENCFSQNEINNFLKLNQEINPRLHTSQEEKNLNYMSQNKKQIPLKNIFLLDPRIIDTIEVSHTVMKK